MQLLIVDGRLGKDAEVKVSQNGDKYLKFSLANRVYKKGEEETVWYDVITSDARFLNKLPEHLKKGSYVIVTGHLDVTVRTVDAKIFTNLTVRPNSIEFGGGGKKNEDEVATTTTVPTPQVPIVNVPTTSEPPRGVFAPTGETVLGPNSSVSLADEAEDDLPF